MRAQPGALWRHGDFLRLWTGQTISLLGSQVTMLALPLTAALALQARPAQMGVMTAIGALPALFLGLPAGAWVDRRRRRPILIAADLGRALLLMAVPALAFLRLLRIEHLYVVGLLTGAFSLLFGVAHRSFLPTLVGRRQLVEGNSKLELSRSIAEIAGPGLAGALVQLVTAPIAIAADALSFVVSALFLASIRTAEPEPPPAAGQQSFWRHIREGLGFVWGNRPLRAIAACGGTLSLFNGAIESLFLLYLTRELGMGAAWLGLSFACGSVGFLAGTLLPVWVSRRFGLGRGIIGALLLLGASDLLVPLVGGSTPLVAVIAVCMAAQFLFGLGLVVYRTGQVSLSQGVTPDRLQGRMNATLAFVAGAATPVGALLGGGLGGLLGLRVALLLAAAGEMLGALWLVLSPVRTLREQPALVE